MTTTASNWLERYAATIGVEAPTEDEQPVLLELAATAAHTSDRIAAPLSCWLAGKSGLSVREAMEAAATLAADLETTA
jgi:Domain of unknown function (DUF6457)